MTDTQKNETGPAAPDGGGRGRGGCRRHWAILLTAAVLVVGAALGYYFAVYAPNFGVVVGGQVYRSAQPSGDDLLRWSRQYGLKTVVNLRGESSKAFYAPERNAAQQAGVKLIDIGMDALRLPTELEVRQLVEALESAPRPMLIHCQAGADRTGVGSVMAAMAIGGQDYAQARSQLTWRYHHFDWDPKHVAGILAMYEEYCRQGGKGTGGWPQFKQWATTMYHDR